MPEAFAVATVFVVSLAAWIGAWAHVRNPANHNVRAEISRLRQHAEWLQDRLDLAEREKWGAGMVAGISSELTTTVAALERAASRSRGSSD
jgi:hypothetical protein